MISKESNYYSEEKAKKIIANYAQEHFEEHMLYGDKVSGLLGKEEEELSIKEILNTIREKLYSLPHLTHSQAILLLGQYNTKQTKFIKEYERQAKSGEVQNPLKDYLVFGPRGVNIIPFELFTKTFHDPKIQEKLPDVFKLEVLGKENFFINKAEKEQLEKQVITQN